MNRKVISAAVAVAMTATMSSFALPANAAEVKTPQYQTNTRQLNRGLIAVKTTADTRGQAVNGVYLSWRLLGDESLENQAFDIYKNGTKIHTTGVHDATNWIDTSGTASDKYKVRTRLRKLKLHLLQTTTVQSQMRLEMETVRKIHLHM